MIIIDTSVYVAAFKPDDSKHLDAVTFIESCQDTILLPQSILQETITVLTYKHSLVAGQLFLEFTQTDPRFILCDDPMMQYIAFWQSLQKRISVIDAGVIFSALSYRIHLETFDQDMKKLHHYYQNLPKG